MTVMLCEPAVREKTWTKAEYYRLGELGFFRGQRVELIEGRILVVGKRSPLQAATIGCVGKALHTLFPTGFHVRCQAPLDLGSSNEPEPAYAVVAGEPRQFMAAHPTTANLIVEVSESTLLYHRVRKGSLYARAGIADYWIVNLIDRQVEVYRDPVPDPTQPHGWRYDTRMDLTPPATVVPLAVSSALAVADLLP